MKKTFYSIAVMVIMFFSSLFLSACGDPAIVGISVKSGTLKEYTIADTEYYYTDLVLKVTYDNDEVKEVAYNNQMTVTGLDTSELGDQVVTISYQGFTTTHTVTVVELDEYYEYLGFQKPDAYTHYEQRESADHTVDTNFKLGGETYKVGDDNPFKFLPKITAVTANGDSEDVIRYNSVVTVKLNGTVLEGTELYQYVGIDTRNSTFDFTEDAIDAGNFEITVQPTTYAAGAPYSPITFIVDVVDGWNVDSVAELSRVEYNPTVKQRLDWLEGKDLWADKKAENGIVDVPIDAVVLHCDLEIKRSDLPDKLFYSAGTMHNGEDISGSLKDSVSFFTRDVEIDKTFTIHGNYFTISTRNTGEDAVPIVKNRDRDGSGMSHSALFAFGGDNKNSPYRTFKGSTNQWNVPQGNVVINNLSLVGNASRESGAQAEDGLGGLLGILSTTHELTLNNCLTRAFITHVCASRGADVYDNIPDNDIIDGAASSEEMSVNINDTKMIDSFAFMMFAWGTRNTYINNSVMKAAGGPLIISTHLNSGDNKDEAISNVTATNCVMENLVMGGEAWFTQTGSGPIITGLKSINAVVTGISGALVQMDLLDKVTSFTNSLNLETGFINFLACAMGDDNVLEDLPIQSSITLKDKDADTLIELDMKNGLINNIVANGYVHSMQDLVFEANGVFTMFNGDTENNPDLLMFVDKQTLIDAGVSEETLNTKFADMFAKAEESDPDKVLAIPMTSGVLYQGHALAQDDEIRQVLTGMVLSFFQAEFYNMYIGNVLGSTLKMYHLDPPQA